MAGYSARQSSFSSGDTITAAHSNDEFNTILAAFNVSTGHTHDGSTAGDGGPISNLFSNALVFGTNANTDIAITFNATSNDGVLTWMEDEDYFQFSDDILLATTEKLQFRDTAVYINSSADGQLDLVADTEIQIAATTVDINGAVDISGNLGVGGNLTVTGTTTFNGGTLTLGDADTDNIVFGGEVDSDIIPDDDGAFDLGSSSKEWKDLFIDGTANIDSLVADTADINGGTIDGAVIGGASAAAITGTAITGTSFVIGSADIGEAELEILDGATLSTDEINLLDGVTATTAELNILDGVTASATDINLIDGITNGTVIASKAIITDSNKDITGGRNITISGELDAATLDISGNADINGTTNLDVVDIDGAVDMATTLTVAGNVDFNGDLDVDGTLETDALTIAGVTLAETISDTVGAMVTSNTESGITVAYQDADNTLDFTIGTLNQDTSGTAAIATTVTITDNENTNENNAIIFTSGGDLDGGNLGLESDGDLKYNPSTGTLSVPNVSVSGTFSTVNSVTMDANNAVIFEGSTADAHETTLTSIDATDDRTISLPNVSGTIPVLAVASNTQITSTPEELNALDGITAVVGELNALDIGSTAVGTAVASKAVILDSNKDYTGIRNLTITGELDAATLDISGDIDVDGTTNLDVVDIDGAVDMASTLQVDGVATFTGRDIHSGGITIANAGQIGSVGDTDAIAIASDGVVTLTQKLVGTELDISGNIDVNGTSNLDVVDIDGAVDMATTLTLAGNADFNGDLDVDGTTNLDVVDIDGAVDMATTLAVTGIATFTDDIIIGDGKTIGSASDVDAITIAANGQLTLTQTLIGTALDISGDADIDGTLEADAITVDGTALATVIAGTTVTNTTNSAHVLVTDNESTNEENLIAFVEGATSSTGNVGLEMDGNFAYNPSTGTVSATIFKGNIDAVDGDFDGTLEADAITIGGTAIASIYSAIAGSSSIVTTGALNSGSITSGFGAINNGSSDITTTGTVNFGSLADGTITVTAFVDEDDMSTNSATLVPTQQSVKAYVDANAGGGLSLIDEDNMASDSAGRPPSQQSVKAFVTGLTGGNIVATGALNSGSVTSGFGNIDTGSSTITTTGLISGGSLDIDNVLINGTTIGHTDDTDLITVADGLVTVAGEISVTTLDIGGTNVSSTAAELNILDGVTSTAAELNILDGVTSTAAELNILDGVTSTAAELNALDGITAVVGELNALDIGSTAVGTAVASKAVILDSNKDYTGIRNLTVSGELDAATGDFSGNVDIDGTLEADAITVNGTALAEVISDTVGAMVSSNTESGITVAYQDADNTLDFTVGTLNQNTTGSAATLTTARTIGGVSFNGSANINLPGVNAAGNQNTSGSAATLTNARTIGGVSFNGSANINLPGVNAAGNQNTSGTAATVTTAAQSNITSLGTLTTLTVDDITINGSTISDGGDLTLDVDGDIILDANGGDIFFKDNGTTFGSATNTSGNLIIKSGTTTAATFSGANVTLAGTVGSGAITSSGNITAFSDQRLKSDIKTIDNALDKVSKMRGVMFIKDGELSSGVIAQEMEQVAPELVMDGEYKSVAYGNIVGYLIESIKELKAEVTNLKCRKECECN